MIAHTDQAVKNMLQTRFGLSAIWTGETVALLTEADKRFKYPTEVNDYLAGGGEIKFPFAAYIRSPGSFDDTRFNTAMAKMGVIKGYVHNDQTRIQLVKMLPVTYPYAIKYYCSNTYEAIKLEKLYWGLKTEPYLDLYITGFPDDFNSNLGTFKIFVSALDGFEPPTTDETYEKGRFYAGGMGFTVSTWVAENAEVPIVQEIVSKLYDSTPSNFMESSIVTDRSWRS